MLNDWCFEHFLNFVCAFLKLFAFAESLWSRWPCRLIHLARCKSFSHHRISVWKFHLASPCYRIATFPILKPSYNSAFRHVNHCQPAKLWSMQWPVAASGSRERNQRFGVHGPSLWRTNQQHALRVSQQLLQRRQSCDPSDKRRLAEESPLLGSSKSSRVRVLCWPAQIVWWFRWSLCTTNSCWVWKVVGTCLICRQLSWYQHQLSIYQLDQHGQWLSRSTI